MTRAMMRPRAIQPPAPPRPRYLTLTRCGRCSFSRGDVGLGGLQAALLADEHAIADGVARLQAVGVRELVGLDEPGRVDAVDGDGDLAGEVDRVQGVEGGVLEAHPGLDVGGVVVGREARDQRRVEELMRRPPPRRRGRVRAGPRRRRPCGSRAMWSGSWSGAARSPAAS